MAETCWFCGTGVAEEAAAQRMELWGAAAQPPDAGGHAVRAVHHRYVKIEVPVPSCPACAARRRRSRFGIWMAVLPGFVLAPLLYWLWLGADAAAGPGLYQSLMIASAAGATAGLLAGLALRLVAVGRDRGAPALRSALQHPEIARLIALGWDPETPFDD